MRKVLRFSNQVLLPFEYSLRIHPYTIIVILLRFVFSKKPNVSVKEIVDRYQVQRLKIFDDAYEADEDRPKVEYIEFVDSWEGAIRKSWNTFLKKKGRSS